MPRRPHEVVTEPLGTLLASVPQSKPSWLTIAKTTAAATIAWAMARQLGENVAVLFAPVIAVLTLQASVYGSIATGLQLLFANLVGTALAIAWTQLLGLTWWSLALAVFAALAVARQITNTPLARNQLTVATLAVLLLAPVAHGYGQWRFIDVAIGSVVGLTIAVIVPERPRIARIRSTLDSWGRTAVGVLRSIADELATRADTVPGREPGHATAAPSHGGEGPRGDGARGDGPRGDGPREVESGGQTSGGRGHGGPLEPGERHGWIAESRKLNQVGAECTAAVAGLEEIALLNVFARGLRRDVEQIRQEQLWLVGLTLQVRAVSLAVDRLYDRPGQPPALTRETLRALLNALAELLEERLDGADVDDTSLRAGLIAAVERVHQVFPTALAALDSVSLLGRLDQLRQDIAGSAAEALIDANKLPRK